MSRPLEPLASALVAVLALSAPPGCGEPAEPSTLVVWTWSEGRRGEATSALARAFAGQQEGLLRLELSPWPGGRGATASTRSLVESLEAASGAVRRRPALLEVPAHALPALVGAGLAFDVGGPLSERMGVVWEDFQPWLMPARLVSSEGVVALPFLVETPLVVFREPAGPRDLGTEASIDRLLDLARLDPASPRRPLAAAADHRLLLWQLHAAGVRLVGPAGRAGRLDAADGQRALARLEALLGGGAVGAGEEGERRALDEVLEGRAVAAWAWSGRGQELARPGLRSVAAPAAPRGTYLVVNARAPWREREAAFRLARWLTEPNQTAALAAELSTDAVRRSAAEGARLRRLPWQRAPRERDPSRGEGPLLPASGAVADALLEVERAMARGDLDGRAIAGLREALEPADPAGEGAR